MQNRDERIFQVIDALGYISLLQDARSAKLLSNFGVNYSQFLVLFLLGNDLQRRWTITELSSHLEMQLPGLSKVVRFLEGKKWVSIHGDKEDARKKRITILSAGIKKRQDTLIALLPVLNETFADWSIEELELFLSYLERLKGYLDQNRMP